MASEGENVVEAFGRLADDVVLAGERIRRSVAHIEAIIARQALEEEHGVEHQQLVRILTNAAQLAEAAREWQNTRKTHGQRTGSQMSRLNVLASTLRPLAALVAGQEVDQDDKARLVLSEPLPGESDLHESGTIREPKRGRDVMPVGIPEVDDALLEDAYRLFVSSARSREIAIAEARRQLDAGLEKLRIRAGHNLTEGLGEFITTFEDSLRIIDQKQEVN